MRPSPLSQASNGLGAGHGREAVATAAEKQLVDLVFAVAWTTLVMHAMAVDQDGTAPSMLLWTLARVAVDGGTHLLICTEPQELRGWARARRCNTGHADKFWAELARPLR